MTMGQRARTKAVEPSFDAGSVRPRGGSGVRGRFYPGPRGTGSAGVCLRHRRLRYTPGLAGDRPGRGGYRLAECRVGPADPRATILSPQAACRWAPEAARRRAPEARTGHQGPAHPSTQVASRRLIPNRLKTDRSERKLGLCPNPPGAEPLDLLFLISNRVSKGRLPFGGSRAEPWPYTIP